MENTLTITYTFTFKNGSRKVFPLVLDKGALALLSETPSNPPVWTLLNFNKCEICPLEETKHLHCPVMGQLRPMVRFHLPFASLTETIFRMASMYLMAQFLRSREGKSAEWSLDGLTRVYVEVGKVNRDFAQRLRVAAKKDANVNALVNLDCFATLVPLAADDMLREIRPYFAAYLEP